MTERPPSICRSLGSSLGDRPRSRPVMIRLAWAQANVTSDADRPAVELPGAAAPAAHLTERRAA